MAQHDFHIVHRIRQQIARLGDSPALRHQVNGEWQDISWNNFGEKIQQLALALLNQGLAVQDKVGIFANNMPRWTVADFASLYNRCVTVPIYPTNTPQQSAYIINDANVKVLFVGEQAQLNIAVAIADQCPNLERIVALTDDVELPQHPLVCHYADFLKTATSAHQVELDTRLNDLAMDDLLTLIRSEERRVGKECRL